MLICPPAIWCAANCICWAFGVADVIGDDVFDDAFDSCAYPFIGDFDALLIGDSWLILRNSQFLQSISFRLVTSACSGHAIRDCCCARNSFSLLCCSRRLVSCDRSAWKVENGNFWSYFWEIGSFISAILNFLQQFSIFFVVLEEFFFGYKWNNGGHLESFSKLFIFFGNFERSFRL